ncbi:MAG: hypothetical protein AB1792_02040 [Candidatus Zixiibacteriota bacterium]
MSDQRLHRRLQRYVWAGLVLSLVASAIPSVPGGAESGKTYTPPEIDLYVYVGYHTIWAGDRFRYTVYDSTNVEARINGMTGELILILPIGRQGPGQYTLPWDGTMHEGTVPFAGKYQLELFFGEEYAAKFWFLCRPRDMAP